MALTFTESSVLVFYSDLKIKFGFLYQYGKHTPNPTPSTRNNRAQALPERVTAGQPSAPELQAEECAKAALRPSGPDLEPGDRSARARESHRLAIVPALPSPSPSRVSAQGCGFWCVKPSCPLGRTAKLSSCLFKLPALVGKTGDASRRPRPPVPLPAACQPPTRGSSNYLFKHSIKFRSKQEHKGINPLHFINTS